MRVVILNSARKFIGEAAHCLALAEQLRRRGDDAVLVVRRGFELEERARQRQLPVVALTMNSRLNPLDDWRDMRRLSQLVRSMQPDLLHCHRGKDHWLAVMFLLLFRVKLPVVRTRHVVVGVRNHLFNRWLYARHADRIIAVSEMAAQSFGSMLPALQGKLQVVYSAVDTSRFDPSRRDEAWRQQHGVGAGQPLVGLVARIQNIKGQQVFLQAAQEVVAKFPEARFLISGAGAAYRFDRLRDYAAKLGIASHVLFEGWLENIESVVASLDVGVIASLGSEGSSRITYEYMASGVPVVATRVGGIPEILRQGESGMLVAPGNARELAQAIMQVLGSEQLASRLSGAALTTVREFYHYDRWVEETRAVYSQAIAKISASGGRSQQ